MLSNFRRPKENLLRLQTVDLASFWTSLNAGKLNVDFTKFVPKEKLTNPAEGRSNRIKGVFYDNQENDYVLEEQADIFSPEGRL